MIYTTPHTKPSDYIIGTSTEDYDIGKKGSDRILLTSVIALMIFGIMAVYSAIAYFAQSNNSTAGNYIIEHLTKLGVAFFVMMLTSKIDYHTIAKYSRFAVVISWILLVGVLLYGNMVFGAKRWLEIGGFSFQPSSFASVALLTHISVMLDQKQNYIKDFKRSFVPIMIWIIITCTLIGVQDFSTAGVLFCLCLLIMFIGRISFSHLSGLVIIGMIGAAALVFQSQERQSRLNQYINQIVVINSENFDMNEGYQTQQAHIAIAKGGLFGVGVGKSTQRNFLPAPYNDFIFAIIAEEYGFMGSMVLVLIFTLILIRGLVYIAKKAPDVTGTLMASAFTLAIVFYGFVNAGVASGLLPVTGLPMPFVSYGGSNMLFTGVMVGILLNISKKHKRPTFNPALN